MRMVSILEWSKDQNNVDRLTVGSDGEVDTCHQRLARQRADGHAQDLYEARDQGEPCGLAGSDRSRRDAFEFGRVRKEAMGAIDQLKIKGPASARSVQWWGDGRTNRAGASGCIVAGAWSRGNRYPVRGRRCRFRRRAQVHDAAIAGPPKGLTTPSVPDRLRLWPVRSRPRRTGLPTLASSCARPPAASPRRCSGGSLHRACADRAP